MGLHQPSDAAKVNLPAFISVHRLATRKSKFQVGDWILDSGAFTTISKYGGYPAPVSEYAKHVRKWIDCGHLLAAVAQDYMCEPHMLAKTGLKIADHHRLTIQRYDALVAEDVGVYIMPVLQGYAPADYVSHIRQYGERLKRGMWVGVGSVCKRNGDPMAIRAVLHEIKQARSDLQLHGFGVKTTSLADHMVRSFLYSADSMAWSFAARIQGRNGNDWREAEAFAKRIEADHEQVFA